MRQSLMAPSFDLTNFLMKIPPRMVAPPPAGTTSKPTIWAADPVDIWNWCSRYLGRKAAKPDTMMASIAMAKEMKT